MPFLFIIVELDRLLLLIIEIAPDDFVNKLLSLEIHFVGVVELLLEVVVHDGQVLQVVVVLLVCGVDVYGLVVFVVEFRLVCGAEVVRGGLGRLAAQEVGLVDAGDDGRGAGRHLHRVRPLNRLRVQVTWKCNNTK